MNWQNVRNRTKKMVRSARKEEEKKKKKKKPGPKRLTRCARTTRQSSEDEGLWELWDGILEMDGVEGRGGVFWRGGGEKRRVLIGQK